MSSKKENTSIKENESSRSKKLTCGIVRPIAAMDTYSESHWLDIHRILSESIIDAGFEPNLVSNSNEINIIHKTIVENLYLNEIIVCDISGKNPNVMLELGMRLAFDKPTIVVKDDATSYSFDTSPIEHITYPKDLRFGSIIDFKKKLTAKIIATYEKSINDENYSTFLKHFGAFTVVKIEQKELSKEDFLIDSIQQLTKKIEQISAPKSHSFSGALDAVAHQNEPSYFDNRITINLGTLSTKARMRLLRKLQSDWRIMSFGFDNDMDKSKLHVVYSPNQDPSSILAVLHDMIENVRKEFEE